MVAQSLDKPGMFCLFFSLKINTLDQQVVDFAQLKDQGKVTVVNFWATDCSTCKKEMTPIRNTNPDLDAYTQKRVDAMLAAGVKPVTEISREWDTANIPSQIEIGETSGR